MIAECLVVEFRVTGDNCPLADASQEAGTTVVARPPQLRADGNVLLRFSAPTDDVAPILDADERVRYLHMSQTEGRFNFRCLAKQRCVVHDLTNAGLLVESLQYHRGTERHTGAVVGRDVLQGVLDTVAARNAEAGADAVGVTLERIYPLGTDDETTVAQQWDITPAQEEALRTAVEMGYFEVPRKVDASAVAAALDISKSSFLERLHRGERGLFSQVF
ncbi:helix-turn-helix domain-containing protein [Haladaptatus sp. DJG-WS-42]|uniref:helix-turn-helix domain-containing protein n=1 Tax=Haladaptatus sp. DJG-WS-42 TaxID=3120516 RepID=UPI0030D3B32A